MRTATLSLLSLAALACHGGAATSSDSRPVPAPGRSSTRIVAQSAAGEALPADYLTRIEGPVRVVVDAVAPDSSWTHETVVTIRHDGSFRFDRDPAPGDSLGQEIDAKLRKVAAAGGFSPLPFAWSDSLSLDLRIVHPPAGMPAPDTSGAYFEFQVTRPAVAVDARSPVYPSALQSGGVGGRVIASFIVGTDGRAEPASFHVLQSPHAELTAAVRDAVLASVYKPAEIKGRKVRQVVMQPFDFAVR